MHVHSILIPITVFTPIVLLAECLDRNVLIETYEHYQKRSFRNRYFLPSGNVLQMLSIPLRKGKNESLPIRLVEIANELPWREQHIKTLQSIYGRSPYFIFYKDELFELIQNGANTLYDFDLKSLKWLFNMLKLDTTLFETQSYEKETKEEILDLRSALKPSLFEGKYLPSYWGSNPIPAQSSALDLLFHMGPDSYSYLESIQGIDLLTKL